MNTITKVSQILEQMEKCGYSISRGKLDQVNLFNKSDMTFKFMTQFELLNPIDKEKLDNDPYLQRIGQNKSYDSGEEESDSDSTSEDSR